MKKINWYRIAFFLLSVSIFLIQACSIFKPKCDCPHF